MMNTLEIVRAGAGSGKTTDLCRTVAQAVATGLDPARILATTFTKMAAAELKGRIQAELLLGTAGNQSAHRNADRLELAAIGTVHSVAHQLLSRYAIELGLSPRLDVITEISSENALSSLIGRIPVSDWQSLADCAERLGIDDLTRRVLNLLAVKRGNHISDVGFAADMSTSVDRVCELLSPTGAATAEQSINQLYDLAEQALVNIDALVNDTQKNTNGARQDLRRLKSKQIPLWGSYLHAIRIEAGKRSGADAMLNALRNHASQVRRNPRLHADLRQFSSLLTRATIRLDSQYKNYKAERGLVDFTDLEILLLELLENEVLATRLAEDYDLILVDEFQDTNPLQLAIFQQLRRFSPRSRWVGDPKQAIYGFRDTDPELVNETWNKAPDAARTELPNNYRSQRGLVQLVGTLFEPIFGQDARQQPQNPSIAQGVERWLFGTRNQSEDATALACGVARLHSEGVRFGDIVILERTNRLLPPIAAAFDALRIPYLLESPGLLSTREGAMVLAGLRLVADRNDSLAAATVVHLLTSPEQDTPDWITERLQAIKDNAPSKESEAPAGFHVPWEGDARFLRIERIDRTLLSPTLVTQQVIEALDLPSLVHRWGESARRCSNLDSLLRHTHEYEEYSFDSGKAATLSGLILYLETLAAESRDFRYPPLGHNAVTLMTYHSAKGLEWPVVVLSGLDSDRSPNMWSPVATGGGNSTENPLAGRTVRSWTWPFGQTDGPFGGLRTGSNLEVDALSSPEGVERAAREAEENMRLLYVGCTRAKQKLVFAHRDGRYAWLERLRDIDTLLNPGLDVGEHILEGIETTFVLRRFVADNPDDFRIPLLQQERWIALPPSSGGSDHIQRFHSPSQVESIAANEKFDVAELPGPSYFPNGAEESQYSLIGDAVHSYFAAVPSMRSITESDKLQIAERCLAAFSITGVLDPSVLVSAGNRFVRWAESTYPGSQWYTEVPVSGARAAGGSWLGTIDLALLLPSGDVVIVDHKSAPIRRADCASKSVQFAGQLNAYAEVLKSVGTSVKETWVHFPLAGVIARRA